MNVVLDASATIAWLYAEGSAEDLALLYGEVERAGAVVPQIWHIEAANVLLTGLRKGRHDLAVVESHIADLHRLRVYVDMQTRERAWFAILQLAAKHRLTSYDASYLELASRRQLPLATLDQALIRAAQAEAVPLFWN